MAHSHSSRRRNARRQQALVTLTGCLVVLIVVCMGCWALVHGGSEGSAVEVDAGSGTGVQDDASSAAEPVLTEEEQRVAQAMATASVNCTKDAPQVTDPATWDERGKALMEGLAADPFYQSEGLKYSAKGTIPYMIAVNRAASTVTVLALDDEGNYTRPYMAMVCSGGDDTPLGFFATPESYDWRLLAGPSYGQYATRIWDSYLFHTVPYYSQHKDDIEYDQFNELGSPASLGCIRLLTCDVKWIYDNCPIGTRVVIYDNAEDPGPMGKPGTIYTDPANESLRGWDPTDPDPSNPWDAAYRCGTAIRSQAAWDEWNAAQADGRWNNTLTPTDLQGWSTDSSVEGTRG
ncbi:MAG: L,D-transpeptidase [Oscillospiraceae bacterium]|nr:L,D-transpeptidase [Oscillospiraceae bacterium]